MRDPHGDWGWLREGAFLEVFVGAFVVVGILGFVLRRLLGRTTYGPFIWPCVLAAGLLWILLGRLVEPISDELTLVGGIMVLASIGYGIRWFFTGEIAPHHPELEPEQTPPAQDDKVVGPTPDAP